MAETTFIDSPLRMLDRVHFYVLYLRQYWSDLLAGRPTEGLHTLVGYERGRVPTLESFEGEVTATTLIDPQHRLREAHDAALDLVARTTEALVPVAVHTGWRHSQEYRDWAWQRLSQRPTNPFGFGLCSVIGLLFCHHVMILQLADWRKTHYGATLPQPTARGGSTARMPLEAMRDQAQASITDLARQLDQLYLNTGDYISHLLALNGLYWCLRERVPRRENETAEVSWDLFLDRCTPEVRAHLVTVAARNEMALLAFPALAHIVNKAKAHSGQQPLELARGVEGFQRRLQDFSRCLIFHVGGVETREPLLIDQVVPFPGHLFRGIRAPFITKAEADKLIGDLTAHLECYRRELFETPGRSRSVLHDGFIAWTRQRFILTTDVHFPLSALSLHVMLYCHNLLTLDVAADRQVEAVVDESLQQSQQRLEQGTPTLGDVFAIYLAVKGLRRILSRRKLGEEHAPWKRLLPQLTEKVRERIFTLASYSPMVWLSVPELEEKLPQRRELLEAFLDDPKAEMLRNHVASCLVAAVRGEHSRDLMAGSVQRLLKSCLESGNVGGLSLVSEFFQILLEQLSGNCTSHASAVEYRSLDSPQPLSSSELAQEFKDWLFDLKQPVPVAIFDLLTTLLERMAQCEKQPHLAHDERLARLRHRWQTLVLVLMHGLYQRPWQPRCQQWLRVFWVNFCIVALQKNYVPPVAFARVITGDDDLVALGCRMIAQLLRSYYVHFSHVWQMQQDALGQVIGEEPHTDNIDASDEVEVIKQLAQSVCGIKRFCQALLAQRLLVEVQHFERSVTLFQGSELSQDELLRLQAFNEALGMQGQKYVWNAFRFDDFVQLSGHDKS